MALNKFASSLTCSNPEPLYLKVRIYKPKKKSCMYEYKISLKSDKKQKNFSVFKN